jgi:hypothetical protein
LVVSDRTFLVLGGAGLVGYRVAHRIITDLHPERVVIASRRESSVAAGVAGLRQLDPSVEVVGEWGDVFVREDFACTERSDLIEDDACRDAIFEDLLGPFEPAYERSRLAGLIRTYRPEVVVDSINTATAISYQDVYTSAVVAERDVEALLAGTEIPAAVMAHDVETLILSLSVPQLIRHVIILHRALREVGSRLYLKIGTSGTGGMGLEIPFTHSEDRPSAKLLTKNAVAFAHTGLLFLMARTGGGPMVKEVKPSTLIGYADVDHRVITEGGEAVHLYGSRPEPLGEALELRLDPAGFHRGDDLRLPVVDTGENGVFTKGEFEVITALGMMEMVTPEEIAHVCIQEITGGNTGCDVIAALDASVLGPTYRAGVLRGHAMEQLESLESETGTHSVALGQLGPPELSKLLWEAEILKLLYGKPDAVLTTDPATVAKEAEGLLATRTGMRDTITSLGLPILLPDGETLLRGPFLRIPEVPGTSRVEITPDDKERWASKGWVDLRAANWGRWHNRLRRMRAAAPGRLEPGSAGYRPETTLADEIEIGAVVANVVAEEVGGRRIK